jgi:hypothetical protein
MKLQILEKSFAVCRLEPKSNIPTWALAGAFFSISRTETELSVVCEESLVPLEVRSETGWRILQVLGTLDFNLTGILASIVNPLAEAKISIFSISTFDTDYVLVKDVSLELSCQVLRSKGMEIT